MTYTSISYRTVHLVQHYHVAQFTTSSLQGKGLRRSDEEGSRVMDVDTS